jgi:hypothetical protein
LLIQYPIRQKTFGIPAPTSLNIKPNATSDSQQQSRYKHSLDLLRISEGQHCGIQEVHKMHSENPKAWVRDSQLRNTDTQQAPPNKATHVPTNGWSSGSEGQLRNVQAVAGINEVRECMFEDRVL